MARDGDGRFPFSFRQLTALVLLVVMMVFIAQNRRSTTVRFLIPETTAPLWVALFVSALLGIVVGGLLARRR
ncbi:MAG: LapA family protein [Actinomycetota bacterium]|nr:LapA family protein [Actinomycetota bacterium]